MTFEMQDFSSFTSFIGLALTLTFLPKFKLKKQNCMESFPSPIFLPRTAELPEKLGAANEQLRCGFQWLKCLSQQRLVSHFTDFFFFFFSRFS